MKAAERLDHEFVEFMPKKLDEGRIYVSIPYATAVHLCACGCGNRVVTPLTPTDWRLIYDGATISLAPSIGNWSFDCQSHYVLRRNRIVWYRGWSRDKVEAGRDRDRRAKDRYYGIENSTIDEEPAWTPRPGRLRRLLTSLRR